jgi:hypothetical protein
LPLELLFKVTAKHQAKHPVPPPLSRMAWKTVRFLTRIANLDASIPTWTMPITSILILPISAAAERN